MSTPVIPPAAPLAWETTSGVCTWDSPTPHRPGSADWNGNTIQNDDEPPDANTMPSAALLDGMMLQLTGYGQMVGNARLSIVAGSPPSISGVTGCSSWVMALLANAFVVTRNGAGSYDITWGPPSGTTTWAPTTVYAANAFIVPNPATGYYYKATSVSGTGTSGAAPPVWPTTVGSTVIDNAGANQIVWTCWGTVNVFPPPVTQPQADLNGASGFSGPYTYSIAAENITNGVRVKTMISGGFADWNFSVTIF